MLQMFQLGFLNDDKRPGYVSYITFSLRNIFHLHQLT